MHQRLLLFRAWQNTLLLQFDLEQLLVRVEGLEDLSKPFEEKEMDEVIKHMPANKSPGPDGFNGLFLKKC